MANQYDVTANQISRRRDLLNALASQNVAQGPGGMAGNVYVGQGLLSALAKPLAMMAANYGQGQLDTQDQANAAARQAAMVQELQGMVGGQGNQPSQAPQVPVSPQVQNPVGTSSFAPGNDQPVNTTGGGSPLLGAMVGQASQAPSQGQGAPVANANFLNSALASQFPEIQALGQAGLKAQLGRKPETFSPQTAMGPDGKPITVLQGNYGTVRMPGYNPAVEPKIFRGEAYNPYDLQPGQQVGAEYKQPTTNNNIQVTPQFMQGIEEKQMSKDIADVHKQRYADALKVLDGQGETQDMLSQIQQLEGLPRVSGTGADLALKAARIGSIFGLPMPEKIVNAAQLDSIVKTQLLQFIRQGGRGITNEEGERFLEAHPNITQDPASAKALRVMLQNGADRAARRAQITIQQIEARNGPDIKPVSKMTPPGLPDNPVLGANGQPTSSVQAQPQAPASFNYDSIQSGQVYQAPDGQWRRKP